MNDDGDRKRSAPRQDHLSTPKLPTIIDLSLDDELEDPTYSPRAPKRSQASPHKTTPRRRKLSDSAHRQGPVPWKGLSQTSLNAFNSPAKKVKTQSTMHSFFGPNELTSPPRVEAKPKPKPKPKPSPSKWARLDVPVLGTAAPLPAAFRYGSPDDDMERKLQEEMATAMLLSQEAQQDAAATPRLAAAKSAISIAGTPTPPGISPIAGPSNYREVFAKEVGLQGYDAREMEGPLFFPGTSQPTTATTTTPATTPSDKLLFADRSTSTTTMDPAPQRSGRAFPVKRKFSEIKDSQEPNSLGSQAAGTPRGGPSRENRASPVQPRLRTPSRNAAPKTAAPTTPRAKYPSSPIPIGSPRRPIDLTISPAKTKIAPLGTLKDATEGTEDEPEFEEYDPYSDVEEIHDLRRYPQRVHVPSVPAKQGPSAQPPPILQSKNQSMAYQLALAARIPIHSKRRPYLSRNARDFLGHIGPWGGFQDFDGYIIHVDFTAREIETLICHISESTGLNIGRRENDHDFLTRAVRELLDLGEDELTSCMRTAASYLQGRNTNDCVLFAEDCLDPRSRMPSSNEFIRVVLSKQPSFRPPENRQKLRLKRELGWGIDKTSIGSEASRRIQNSVIHSIKPWRVFKGGSSDILDIAWSPSGDKFALGAATFSDVYNRAGNLLLGSVGAGTVKMLHGHQTMRPEPLNGLDPIKHCTVSAVGFSPSGLLFSGGYDGTVKVWAPDTPGVPRVCEREFDGQVEVLSISPNHQNLIAAGCRSGTLELSSWDDDGTFLSSAPCVLQRNTTEVLYPSCLTWYDGFHSQYLIAGYDTNTDRSPTGSLVIYDAESGRQFVKVTPGSTRCFDVVSHPSGSFVVACAARGAKNLGVKSTIRMFHVTGTGTETEFDVDSEQEDINRVTISPCGTYVTSSDTSGTTLLWDARYPAKPLHRLTHGPTLMPITQPTLPQDDTGVTLALWDPTHAPDFFYTGSSDGVVKIWDVKRADPFVRDLAKVDAQIMSGKWAPGGDFLVVGDTSGSATVLSTLGGDWGSEGGEGGGEIPLLVVEGEVLPERAGVQNTELGRYYSRELLREGRVVVGYGPNGYGAYGA